MTGAPTAPAGDVLDLEVEPPSRFHRLQGWLVRQAVAGFLPLRWMWPRSTITPEARTGRLHLEIVSHCWNYSHLLEFQLGSLVAHPPRQVDVTLAVYYSPEDARTVELLRLASEARIDGLTWDWRPLAKGHLFRRSIGRNHAALSTSADWIWFTDCDVIFREGCLDALAEALQGSREPLVYPAVESLTPLLGDDVIRGGEAPALREPPAGLAFTTTPVRKAKGPLQITHGDIARELGYCRDLRVYQRAEPSFAKCYEDTAFRWLLGTHGAPVDVDGVARVRHSSKGRYSGSGANTRVRKRVRRLQELLRRQRA